MIASPAIAPHRLGRARRPVDHLVVVVPVHDERDLLGRCLRSLEKSRAHPFLQGCDVRVVVVLDHCTDGSDRVARHLLRPDDHLVEVDARNVGVARATGVSRALERLDVDPDTTWLAHTDADSEVPRQWLAKQLLASQCTDAAAGVVRVRDWSAHSSATRRRFTRAYGVLPFGSHPHVHGANLGVRASTYLDVGGFPAVAYSEDHALWGALRAAGHRTWATRWIWVSTSGRPVGRAQGGFADTLSAIGAPATAVDR
jgi:glycosyltransferase involved in cell wall biosynthesis